jgi:hypothetical protein
MNNILEYDDKFGSSNCKKVEWKEGNGTATQRKYPVK